MAIRMRRGNYRDFDPTRMLAGEFAVCLDNGYIYMTLSPGNVVRLGTFETIEEALALAREYMRTAESYATGQRDGTDVPSTDPAYHNNSKYYAETVATGKVQDAEAWAVGERGGVPVGSQAAQYHNNSKYYAETIAKASAEDSEAWAIGKRNGTDVPSTDPSYHNNSKYYSEQTETYYEYVESAVETHAPNFEIDWSTGELLYSGGYFTFWVDTDGYLKWGVEPT